MAVDKHLVRLHFDRHAHEYDRFAGIQREMASRVTAIAHDRARAGGIATVRRILEIGCGTGSLTSRLLEVFPDAALVCVDLSPNMLAVTRSKLERSHPESVRRVVFLEGDAEHMFRDGGLSGPCVTGQGQFEFDLVVSNAAFQWFNEPASAVRSLLGLLRPDRGALVFSTFGPQTFRELHNSFRKAEEMLGLEPAPHGQSLAGGEVWHGCFAGEAGRWSWEEQLQRPVFANVREFLYQVKRIGAGNAVSSTAKGVGGRRLIETMERCYWEAYAIEGGIPATYHLGFGAFIR